MVKKLNMGDEMKFAKYLLIIFISLIFSACGGGGGGSSTQKATFEVLSSGYNLVYSEDRKSISGTINFRATGFSGGFNWEEVKLRDIDVSVGSCKVSSLQVLPSSLTFVDLNPNDLRIKVEFENACYSNNLAFVAQTEIKVVDISDPKKSTYETDRFFENFTIDYTPSSSVNIDLTYPSMIFVDSNYTVNYRLIDNYSGNLVNSESINYVTINTIDSDVSFIENGNLKSSITKTANQGSFDVHVGNNIINNSASFEMKVYLKNETILEVFNFDANATSLNTTTTNTETTEVIEVQKIADNYYMDVTFPSAMATNSNYDFSYSILSSDADNPLAKKNLSYIKITSSDSNYIKIIDVNNVAKSEVIKYTPEENFQIKSENSAFDGTKYITLTLTAYFSDNTTLTKQITIALDYVEVPATTTTTNVSIATTVINSMIANEKYDFAYEIFENSALSTNLKSVTIKSSNPSILQILDSNAIAKDEIVTYENKNSFKVQTYNVTEKQNIDISITAVIEVDGKTTQKGKTVTIQIDPDIYADPIASMSIVYKDTTYDESTAPFFVDRYVVHVTDKSGNPSFDGKTINIGAITELKRNKNDNTKVAYYPKSGSNYAVLNKTFYTTISDNGHFGFSDYDIEENSNDRLIIFPNDERNNDYSYLGGWTINNIENNHSLILVEDYSGAWINKLSFAIGDEDKYDRCNLTNAVADFRAVGDDYTIKNGIVELELRYDPYLVGKDVFFYANLEGVDGIHGISMKRVLTGKGLDSATMTCSSTSDTNSTNPTRCREGVFVHLKETNEVLAKDILASSYECSGDCGYADVAFTKPYTGCEGTVGIEVVLYAPSRTVNIQVRDIMASQLE